MLVASRFLRRGAIAVSSSSSFAMNSRYITTVTMPSLSPTMEAGKVASWVKKEGDKLNSGDVLATIETDKATMDFQFQDDDMILAKILVPEGTEDVKVGTAVAIVVDNAADLEKVRSGAYTAATATPAGGAAPKAAPTPAPAAPAAPAAPKAAPTPAPTPAPIAAKPAPVAPVAAAPAVPVSTPSTTSSSSSNSSEAPYLAFEAWGSSLNKSGLGILIGRQQKAYTDAFGYSGHDPIPLPEEKPVKGSDEKKPKK